MHDKEIKLFTEGLKQAHNEFYLDAVKEFQKLVDDCPDSELADDALYNIGLCYFNINQFEKAISFFNKVITDYPDATISILDGGNEFGKTAAKCHYAIVNCCLALGNIGKAKEHAAITINYPNSYVKAEDEKRLFADLASNAMAKYLKNV